MSNLRTSYFNLHGFVNIRLTCIDAKVLDLIQQKLSYFESGPTAKTDIDLFVNTLPEDISLEDLRGNKSTSALIYNKAWRRFARWEVFIKDIEGETATIFFFGNHRSLKFLFFNFLEPIINLKLVRMGCCLVHASGFKLGEKGYVVHGYPAAGKSSILLRSTDKNMGYLADEMTIISSAGYAHSYPTPLSLPDYSIRKLTGVSLSLLEKLRKIVARVVRVLTKESIKLTIEIDPTRIQGIDKVIDNCKVDASCVINTNMVRLSDSHELTILKINQWQYRYFKKMVDAHLVGYPQSHLTTYWDDMFQVIEAFGANVEKFGLKNELSFEAEVRP